MVCRPLTDAAHPPSWAQGPSVFAPCRADPIVPPHAQTHTHTFPVGMPNRTQSGQVTWQGWGPYTDPLKDFRQGAQHLVRSWQCPFGLVVSPSIEARTWLLAPGLERMKSSLMLLGVGWGVLGWEGAGPLGVGLLGWRGMGTQAEQLDPSLSYCGSFNSPSSCWLKVSPHRLKL